MNIESEINKYKTKVQESLQNTINTLNNGFIIKSYCYNLIKSFYMLHKLKNNIDYNNKWFDVKEIKKYSGDESVISYDESVISDDDEIKSVSANEKINDNKIKINNKSDIDKLQKLECETYDLSLLLENINLEKMLLVASEFDNTVIAIIRKISVNIKIVMYSQNRFMSTVNKEFTNEIIKNKIFTKEEFMNANGFIHFAKYMLGFVNLDDQYILFLKDFVNKEHKNKLDALTYLVHHDAFIKAIGINSNNDYIKSYFYNLYMILQTFK